MTTATRILITLVCNFTTMHVALAEGVFTERMQYTPDDFDAAVNAAVATGMIKEENNWLTVVK